MKTRVSLKYFVSYCSLFEFNIILDSISHEDKIGQLFTLDIKFVNKNEKTQLFNEIYTPIFEKEKEIEAQYSSVLQLLPIIRRNDEKNVTRKIKASTKTHATFKEKKLSLFMPRPFIIF